MALCVAAVFFIYGLLFIPVAWINGNVPMYVFQDLLGMVLIILVSLAYSWKLKFHFPEKQLSKINLWIFSYHTFLFAMIFYLWATGSNVSITPLFIIIICLGFTSLHTKQYLIYITVLLSLMLIAISLISFDYFWFLEFVIIYLFAVSLHIFRVFYQCQLFQYQSIIERERNMDSLTGLLNRRALSESFEHCEGAHPQLAAILMDLDHFKNVNDTFGHSAGDQAISYAADVLKSVFRKEDLVSRIGGDEFFILIELCDSPKRVLTEKIQQLLSRFPLTIRNEEISLSMTVSVGAYLCTNGREITLEQLIEKADGCMYAVKENGRNAAMIDCGQELSDVLPGRDTSFKTITL